MAHGVRSPSIPLPGFSSFLDLLLVPKFSTNMPSFIFKHFNSGGRFVSVHSTSRPFLPHSILSTGSKLGVVYFCEEPDEEFLGKVSDLDLFDSYRSWLIVKSDTSYKFEEVLRGLNLGLDTDMVVGKIERRSGGTATTTQAIPTVTREKGHVQNHTRRKRDLPSDLTLVVRLIQVYKAARTENDTLTVPLGLWDAPNGLFKVKGIINEEHRWNLGGYKVHVGVKNSSLNVRTGPVTRVSRFAMDVEADEEKNFMELFSCLIHGINASFELVKFQRIGWKNEEGGWTHLLGGVVDETVDFALETIDVNVDKSGDMSFTHAIVTTMNNIYFHRPISGGMRDIFLAPFSPKLVLCVLMTSLLLAIAMISISIARHNMISRKETTDFHCTSDKGKLFIRQERKKWKISDAVLWSVSILCMQGSQWSPKSMSGNLLLINGLLFALVIYNSFAAFITSVLSVQNISIKDLKDLADSDLAFGYTLGNADELFLRTVNNTLLRELYFKGLRENDGVSDPVAGVHRAAKGKYAFFVAARTARRALRTVVAHDKRCEFQELCLKMTKNHASIPMRRQSSLKKIVNLKIIHLMETGLLRRFQNLMLLSMPSCDERTTFNSARLADVYSAFFVLGFGWVASFLILILEVLWWKRKNVNRRDRLNKNTFEKARERPATKILYHWQPR
ncbi:hypothetical protein RUM44_009007 [Polyplax serrata]|uniref:Ionotropic glutamate receptor C-terminal domain-containing protein n=1 Tax=Polyplax serrata TaxID=468196 RepID=A0ABR1ARF9_POLSC